MREKLVSFVSTVSILTALQGIPAILSVLLTGMSKLTMAMMIAQLGGLVLAAVGIAILSMFAEKKKRPL